MRTHEAKLRSVEGDKISVPLKKVKSSKRKFFYQKKTPALAESTSDTMAKSIYTILDIYMLGDTVTKIN